MSAGPHEPSRTQRLAVCAPAKGPDADLIHRCLSGDGIQDARWFAPKDADELNAHACEGDFDAVLFPSTDALLDAVLDGNIHLDDWLARGISIRIASDGPVDSIRLTELARCVRHWSSVQRKRRMVAGTVLSAIALACAVALFMLSRLNHGQ